MTNVDENALARGFSTLHAGKTYRLRDSNSLFISGTKAKVIGSQFDRIIVQTDCPENACCPRRGYTRSWIEDCSILLSVTYEEFCGEMLTACMHSVKMHDLILGDFDTFQITFKNDAPKKRQIPDWPHVCDRCRGPALRMMNTIDCKFRCAPDRTF
jgi:hypothetical protein